MKRSMQYGFTSLLIIAIATALYVSGKWNATTAFFPRAVGFPLLFLLVSILVTDIKKGRRRDEQGDRDNDRKFAVETALTALYLSWLAGFIALSWAIGLLYAIPIYVVTYMRIQGKHGWLQSGLYAIAATVFVFFFGYLFQMAWPEGALLNS
jgi:hypothetical protein